MCDAGTKARTRHLSLEGACVMLTLRRGVIISAGSAADPMQELEVDVDNQKRPALADVAMVGPSEPGDQVVVNIAALDLELGSGGFDLVHVNLTRGLSGEVSETAHVMKMNYTSLQHAVAPVEEAFPERAVGLEQTVLSDHSGIPADQSRSKDTHCIGATPTATLTTTKATSDIRTPGKPAAVMMLHGQLAPLAWSFHQSSPKARLGYIQTSGGALIGGLSKVVRELRSQNLLAGHISAGATYGGEEEAITLAGALHYGFIDQEWDAVVCGPGPGILGSGTVFGHGGMVALDSAHTAAAMGCSVVIAPRCSSGDPRVRHRGISHHTRAVLTLGLAPFTVAVPDHNGRGGIYEVESDLPYGVNVSSDPDLSRHHWTTGTADLNGYAETGLPSTTMGRSLEDDPEFFLAALAAGSVLAGDLSHGSNTQKTLGESYAQ